MSKNSVTMFDYLKDNYGISKRWIATKLGIKGGSFQFYEENGFPPEMLRQIETILNDMGKDLSKLRLPKSMERKEAA